MMMMKSVNDDDEDEVGEGASEMKMDDGVGGDEGKKSDRQRPRNMQLLFSFDFGPFQRHPVHSKVTLS